MYFDLSDEQRAFVETVKDFAAKEIAPGAIERDRAGEWFAEGWRKMGQLGLLGLQFPEAFGGSGADVLTTAAAFQAFTAGGADAGIALSWVAHSVLAGTPLWLFGNDDQKRRYLSRIASGQWTAGYGLTESGAGSDAASLQTTAAQRGDRWILNGSKMFITNAPIGDVFVVFASEDRKLGSRGITAFIVESSFAGFARGRELDKLGNRTSPTGELIFENCEVPAENVLGERRKGFTIAKTALEWERFLMMAHSVGTMEAVLADSLRYARERRQFGKSIAEQPAIQVKLADMRVSIAAGELFVRRVAWLKDQGLETPLESSSCKIFTSAAVVQTALQGVQVLGGFGYVRENAVERAMRDAKLAEIGGGTTEIQRQVVGRSLLKASSQRWDYAYTPVQTAARERPPSEASDLVSACLALTEHARESLAGGLLAMAHETVRWSLRLAGREELLAPPEERRVSEEVASQEIAGANGGPAVQTMVAAPATAPRATYSLGGPLVLDAPNAQLLLTPDRLLTKPADWTSKAVDHCLVPGLPLGRVEIGEGQAAGDSRLHEVSRLFCAALASGVAEAALDEALVAARAKAAKPGDEFDSSRQLVEFRLADLRTRLDGSRMLVHRAAVELERGQEALEACRTARLFACEAAVFCVEQAVAVAGAFGSSRLEELQRDCHVPGSLDQPLEEERLALADASELTPNRPALAL